MLFSPARSHGTPSARSGDLFACLVYTVLEPLHILVHTSTYIHTSHTYIHTYHGTLGYSSTRVLGVHNMRHCVLKVYYLCSFENAGFRLRRLKSPSFRLRPATVRLCTGRLGCCRCQPPARSQLLRLPVRGARVRQKSIFCT